MLFQPTNLLPDERAGIGFGTVDASQGISFSWQVNGDYPVMTAFRIQIYRNNAASSPLYDTGRLADNCPFSGRNELGEPVLFEHIVAAQDLNRREITNGNEYKYTVTQYYMDGGAETSIRQSSASVFRTRSAPSFAFDGLNGNQEFDIHSAEHSFQLSYSQNQGDTLDWVRYRIAYGDPEAEPVFDSGVIFGAALYSFHYSGFLSRNDSTVEALPYYVRAAGQTSSGQETDTGWTPVNVDYTVGAEAQGSIHILPLPKYNAVMVDWRDIRWMEEEYDSYALFRRQEKDGRTILKKLAEIPNNHIQDDCVYYDFGAASGQGPYQYYVFPQKTVEEIKQYVGSPALGSISPASYLWSLLECREDGRGGYTVEREFDFRYNLDSGSVGNNNSPNILQNFTAKPTVQPSPQNYRSGTLRAMVGSVRYPGKYSDSLEERNALMSLSTTENALFLKSGKGDVLQIRLSGPVTVETAEGTKALAQTVTLPWVEIGDGEPVLYRTGIMGVLPPLEFSAAWDEGAAAVVLRPSLSGPVRLWKDGTLIFNGSLETDTYYDRGVLRGNSYVYAAAAVSQDGQEESPKLVRTVTVPN